MKKKNSYIDPAIAAIVQQDEIEIEVEDVPSTS